MNNAWLRQTIRSFEPYVVPEIRENTVINANESPYNIFDFPDVKQKFLALLDETPSCRYPDPFASRLRAALGTYVGCQPDEVLVGNGGDEIISLIINTFLDPGDMLLTHTPTFDIYAIDAAVVGAHVLAVPDLDGFVRDKDGILKAIADTKPKLTILCNPNNPTGELLPLSYLEDVLNASDNPVVVDEAYMEFSGSGSIIAKLRQYPNLIVIRTLSKAFGLAGMRIGYAVAQADVIEALSLTKLVYNMNIASQAMGLAAMTYCDRILAHNVPPVVQVRDDLFARLGAIDGVTAYRSAANFVLVRVPDGPAVIQALHDADICVRSYSSETLRNCLRITATTADTAERVIRVFKEVMRHAQCTD